MRMRVLPARARLYAAVLPAPPRLDAMGYDIGHRFLELSFAREKAGKRELKIINLITYVSANLWKTLFGRKADGVEKSKERDNCCKRTPSCVCETQRERDPWCLHVVRGVHVRPPSSPRFHSRQ